MKFLTCGIVELEADAVEWSAFVPSVIALLGIPLGVYWTGRRDDRVRRELWEHEEQTSAKQQLHWIQQQWWHEKQKSYALLIEAMYQLKTGADESLAYMWSQLDGTADANKHRTESRWKENLSHIKRINEIGAFTVSENAAKVVSDYFAARRELQKAWDEESLDPFEVHEEDVVITKKCLADLRQAALLDLGVKTGENKEIS